MENIKPSTMAVINQELESIELPEHLKPKEEPKIEMQDEFLATPEKPKPMREEIEEDKEDYFISPVKNNEEENYEEEDYEEVVHEEVVHEEVVQEVRSPVLENRKSSKTTSNSRKSSRLSMNKSRKSSNFSKPLPKAEPKEFLAIKDIGNKEVRDKKDAKTLWSPNELRTDIILKVREQIKNAFGAKIEKDCFSTDFKKHIECLKLFESAFELDYPDIDGFFCIIDLILKWIFIKG